VSWTSIKISSKKEMFCFFETINIANSNSMKWCFPASGRFLSSRVYCFKKTKRFFLTGFVIDGQLTIFSPLKQLIRRNTNRNKGLIVETLPGAGIHHFTEF
jgi:hypothetical protein